MGYGVLVTNTNRGDRYDSLSDIQAKLPGQRAPSDAVFAWMEEESCRITEDAVVDVGVLHHGAGIRPLAVENETDSQGCRRDQQRPEWRNVFLPVAEVHRCISLGAGAKSSFRDQVQFPTTTWSIGPHRA